MEFDIADAAEDLYPVTVIATRYGGSYEGASWAAFNRDPDAIPSDATGDDVAASGFWWGPDAEAVGRGATPDAAVADLAKRMHAGEAL